MFTFPPPPTPPPDPDRAVLLRRPLAERLLETLRYLAEEIEPRRVGRLSEAQAAGYVAGRLNRAEQQAVVLSFRSDAAPWLSWTLLALGSWLGGAMSLLVPRPTVLLLSTLWAALLALIFWDEQTGHALVSQALGFRTSQSVVGVRAATAEVRHRAVVIAPLDGPPRTVSPRLTQLTLAALVAQAGCELALLAQAGWASRGLLLAALVLTTGLLALLWWTDHARGPQPGVLGAGELAVLLAISEELEPLAHTELWTVAAGGGMVGDASLRQLLRRYPFDATTAFINLDRMAGGDPVFVTREGALRQRRSDRRLLALAGAADAHDRRINATPRPLRRRTLARLPLGRGLPTITLTSYTDAPGLRSPDPDTLVRCVYLALGMLRELDRTGLEHAGP